MKHHTLGFLQPHPPESTLAAVRLGFAEYREAMQRPFLQQLARIPRDTEQDRAQPTRLPGDAQG